MNYFDELNEEQIKAVQNTEGPLLVLAGAGTGKTKVLTTRIAHIINQGKALPHEVLAVTFTNKAAKEMQHRINNLLSKESTDIGYVNWCGTFHSISSRILRQYCEPIGFSSNFAIIDQADQLKFIKQLLKDKDIDEKSNPAKVFAYFIGRYKDKAWIPSRVPQSEIPHYANGRIIELYKEYQVRLKSLQLMDFGDLILNVIQLMNQNLDICEYYQNKFKYILVDEYQDTNVAQYLWLRLFAQKYTNICCVGDDDQSIYGWRGAEVKNILRFEKDFANAKIIRLEQNYRSTKHILDAASTIISNNEARHGKRLWTEGKLGRKISICGFYDDMKEARVIADKIDSLNKLNGIAFSNIAILIRASYQTRSFEESLNYMKIPYKIIGGAKFYERAEIKDALAYIKVITNPDDNFAFERMINVPRRGIGEATLSEIATIAKKEGISMMRASEIAVNNALLKPRPAKLIQELIENIKKWQKLLKNSSSHVEAIDRVLNESGYIEMLKTLDQDESKERLDNIKELIRSLSDFTSIQDYLEHVSLVSDIDAISDENRINILTIHAAKGLEFEVVFLPGWEEGIFPSSKSITDSNPAQIEEERRLAYVAITRAKKELYISYACHRRIYGSYQETEISRFIDELPQSSCEIHSPNNTIMNTARMY